MEAIIGSVITAIASVITVALTNRTNQKVTDTKIDELTREVREHNNFARRVPVVEEQIRNLDDRVKKLENK